MFRGIPMGYENKVSRPSAGFMINKAQLRFKNCTDNTYIDTCLHHQVWTFLFSRRREVNNYLPLRGESEKLEKANGSMLQGQVFLKGVAGTFPI